jgi:threonine dehydratase
MDGTPARWKAFDSISIAAAAERVRGVVRRTPLVPFEVQDERVEVRLKLENRQETGAFKARGAWNQVSQLSPAERAAGVVCTSSGNHGKALAWAAERAGVRATIVMPANAYPNKIEACRSYGAEVVLCPTRADAEAECERRVRAGATLVHPYDAQRTLQGAGTVGLEIAEDWPEVELVLVPVGGGGLASGVGLALRQRLGAKLAILGVEPRGAPSLTRGLEAERPVHIEIQSQIQGLTPPYSGQINIDVCRATLDGTLLVDDEEVYAAQRELVRAGETVEPAGSAALAALLSNRLPPALLARRGARDRLRTVVLVSGGNPDPAQLERVRAEVASARP